MGFSFHQHGNLLDFGECDGLVNWKPKDGWWPVLWIDFESTELGGRLSVGCHFLVFSYLNESGSRTLCCYAGFNITVFGFGGGDWQWGVGGVWHHSGNIKVINDVDWVCVPFQSFPQQTFHLHICHWGQTWTKIHTFKLVLQSRAADNRKNKPA